ncbi:polysaccharide pyruvyl transferase family protein [Enterococcus sp. OL5]|uniref:polysaccharide pyruvyl transferase family protein n=1 Tax=Enterococcus sp. OL5 TaxID=2590214 RepID=UPI00112DE570|nr:polysaccharide pyruvyl transferase family protein [Enterococcus sp. OL5]TPR59620.1 polysaccharide pyruvyl transferase family protein [Enterococcus sp. OL5]
MEDLKKATVLYLWGRRNAGDMAISLGAISLLKELHYDINFISRFTVKEEDYFENVKYINAYYDDITIHPGFFSLDRNKNKLDKSIDYLRSLFFYINPKNKKKVKGIMEDSDVVFLNGGNLFRCTSIADYIRLKALFYPQKYLGSKKFVSLPQSSVKSNKLGEFILKRDLNLFNKIFIRESLSYQYVREILPKKEVLKSTDMAFFISNNEKAEINYKLKYSELEKSSNNIGFILRATTLGDLQDFSDEERNQIKKTFIELINNKLKEGFNVNIIVQTRKDYSLSLEIYEYFKSSTEKYISSIFLIEEYDTLILREIYKKMNYCVTMRLHAAILSMNVNTPVVGYFFESWGKKNPGILGDVGMEWTFTADNILQLTKLTESNIGSYKEKIKWYIENEKQIILEELIKL